MQPIDVDKKYHFFNPRAGIHYTLADRHNFYASFAVAQKEPTRSDFTDRYMFSATTRIPRPRNSTTMNLATGTTRRNSAQA